MSQEPPKAIVDFTGFQRTDPNHATALVIKLAIQLVDHAQWDDCAGGLVADPADVMDLNDAIYTLPRSIIEAARDPLSDPLPAAPSDAGTHNMHRSSTNQEPESGRTDAEKRMNTDCS